jgi:hypothetical protein
LEVTQAELDATSTAASSAPAVLLNEVGRLVAVYCGSNDDEGDDQTSDGAEGATTEASSTSRQLETSSVPYCIEPCAAVFEKLTDLLEQLKPNFLDPTAPATQRRLLLSVLRLLQANMHRLLLTDNPTVIKEAVGFELRTRLQTSVTELTDALPPPSEAADQTDPWAAILKSALTGLASEAMRLFFTDEEYNCNRLAAMVQKYVDTPGKVTEIELQQVVHLLQRLRKSDAMRSALVHSGHCGALLSGLIGISTKCSQQLTMQLIDNSTGGSGTGGSGTGGNIAGAESFKLLTAGVDVGLHEIWELSVANALCGRGLDEVAPKEGAEGGSPEADGAPVIDQLGTFCAFSMKVLCEASAALVAAAGQALDSTARPADSMGSVAADKEAEVASKEMAAAVDRILHSSVLGELLPPLLGAIARVSGQQSAVSASTAACIPPLIRIRAQLGQLIGHRSMGHLVQQKQPPLQPKKTTAKVERTVQSAHPYRDDHDETFHISIPGAKSISLCFDPQTETERRHDHVRVYKRSDGGQVGRDDGYSGSSSNWPGVGGNSPLVIDGEQCYLKWHSDGSGTAWGWKLTATAMVEQEETVDATVHWLHVMARSVSATATTIVPTLFEYPRWDPPREAVMSKLLQQQLFFAGRSDGSAQGSDTTSPRTTASTRQLAFLGELIEQTPGSAAVALATKMRGRIKMFLRQRGLWENVEVIHLHQNM